MFFDGRWGKRKKIYHFPTFFPLLSKKIFSGQEKKKSMNNYFFTFHCKTLKVVFFLMKMEGNDFFFPTIFLLFPLFSRMKIFLWAEGTIFLGQLFSHFITLNHDNIFSLILNVTLFHLREYITKKKYPFFVPSFHFLR